MRRMILWLLLALALAGCRTGEEATTAEDVVTVTRPATAPPAAPTDAPAAATKGFWDTATPTADDALWPTASPTATATPANTATATPTAIVEPSPTPPPPAAACVGRPADWFPQPILPGDTVGALAACVGASVGEVLAANCLTANDTIFAGGTLWLPAACATIAPTRASEETAQTQPSLVINVLRPEPPRPSANCPQPGYQLVIEASDFPADSLVYLACTAANNQACSLNRSSVTTGSDGSATIVVDLPANTIGPVIITAWVSTPPSTATFTVELPSEFSQRWCTPTPAATETPTATATVTPVDTATATATPTATSAATETTMATPPQPSVAPTGPATEEP